MLIDAGAGAGKTTLLVERILTLIAPADDSAHGIPLGRIAAVTFTRRAAGELRVRVRQRILSLLARADASERRKKLLLDALGTLDASFIGTIHSFADRLLRLQPMKARLSPAYQIAEDVDGLVEETFALLLQAVQSGTLVAELPGEDPNYVAEVERTFQEALRAGLVVRSREMPAFPSARSLVSTTWWCRGLRHTSRSGRRRDRRIRFRSRHVRSRLRARVRRVDAGRRG